MPLPHREPPRSNVAEWIVLLVVLGTLIGLLGSQYLTYRTERQQPEPAMPSAVLP